VLLFIVVVMLVVLVADWFVFRPVERLIALH
jgi:hypothetical protein